MAIDSKSTGEHFGRRNRTLLRLVLLVVLMVAAFGVRWLWEPHFTRRGPDAREYLQLAETLHQHGTYSLDESPPLQPSRWRAPVFPALLAATWHLTGVSYDSALLLQAALGSLTVLLLFMLTRRLYGERAAWWAAALVAFYPPHVVLSSVVLSEVLFGVWLLAALLLMLTALEGPRGWRRTVTLAAAGLVLALAALTRTEGFLFPFLLAPLLLLLPRRRRPRWVEVGVLLLAFLLPCGAWMARNAALFGEASLVHPVLPYRGLIGGLDLAHSDPLVDRYYDFRHEGAVDPGALEDYQKEVIETYRQFVRQQPGAYLTIRAKQMVRFWVDSASARSLHGGAGERWWRVASDLAFGALLLLWVLVELARRPPFRLEAVLLLAYPVYITLVVLPLEADFRYSVPARLLLLALVGASLAGARRSSEPRPPVADPGVLEQARRRLEEEKIAVFVAGGSKDTGDAADLVRRIDPTLRAAFVEIFAVQEGEAGAEGPLHPVHRELRTYRTPFPRQPGGLRKLGLLHALRSGYDAVIVLDGEGHQPPEALPGLLAAAPPAVDAVFGVRAPLGPPWRRWGAAALHAVLRAFWSPPARDVLGGPRLYRRRALERIPFLDNTDRAHFDFEVAIQARVTRWHLREVEVPVAGPPVRLSRDLPFAAGVLKTLVRYYLVQLGIFSRRKYDFLLFEDDRYQFKESDVSLHQNVLRRPELAAAASSVELGANRGLLSARIAERVKRHVAVDLFYPDRAGRAEARKLDLDGAFATTFEGETFDCAVALDVIEHLNSPEAFLEQVTRLLRPGGTLLVSTANIAYLPMRVSLLLGQFNYGKRGILDRTHKRLFTVGSFVNLLDQYGYDVLEVKGFSPPLTDLLSGRLFLLERIHTGLSRIFPRWFGFNFLVVARRRDTLDEIFSRTTAAS